MRASAPAWGCDACVEANGGRVPGCSGEGSRYQHQRVVAATPGASALAGVVVLSIVLVTYARRAQAIKMRK